MKKFKSDNMADKYTDMIYRIAIKILRNDEDCKDIIQDLFLHHMAYVEKNKGFNDEEHEKYWIIRVTTNLCYNQLKKASNKNLPLNIENVKESYFNENDIILLDGIKRLPEKYRKVFELFYVSGFKLSEISKILNIRESTAKMRLKRARDKYKEIMKDGGE